MEYAVQAWRPWLEQDKKVLEDVQRRAIRNIPGLHGTYEEKLAQVNLTTLEARRERGDMIQTFKILNKIDDVDPKTWFTPTWEGTHHETRASTQILDDGTAVHGTDLIQPASVHQNRRNFFSNRVVLSWNNLPQTVKNSGSVCAFKHAYDEFIKR